ncbi:glycosyltransferase family 2 protein [Ruegeria sp. HKCCC2117]|uniref:glycosyltransferase family 2 protein n=1 Tax=Ruegeria sp. HKCCC2117 TaxID=2682992 RepID=UPI0014899170|nr:glycosyltransferase family 2 protein [Ruegeria sp. HKCCC2117]
MIKQDPSQPDISVIVAIVDGGEALRTCLTALANQRGDYDVEVIVPFDQLSQEAAGMAEDFPDFRFLDLGVIAGNMVPQNALDLHRFWDIRRSEGIKVARGRLIGLVEDRGIPADNWIVSVIELQDQTGAAAVGGCADNGYDTIWNWAIHICDFGRYMAPVPTGEADFLSATNVCYLADTLHELRPLYENRFYEPSIHAALQAAGHKMVLSDHPRTTEYRPRIPTTTLALEWFHWGRKYARIRCGEISFGLRVFRAAVTPILPFVLFFRHLGNQRRKRIYLRKFWLASPLIFMIVSMWACGELVGYFQGEEPETL